jgi:hypothetical protein
MDLTWFESNQIKSNRGTVAQGPHVGAPIPSLKSRVRGGPPAPHVGLRRPCPPLVGHCRLARPTGWDLGPPSPLPCFALQTGSLPPPHSMPPSRPLKAAGHRRVEFPLCAIFPLARPHATLPLLHLVQPDRRSTVGILRIKAATAAAITASKVSSSSPSV